MAANNRIVTRIFWTVLAAVGLIALGSFALSFMALHELATANGIPLRLGWIWPLIVDVSMVIYTAAILVAQLQRRAARLPIGLTIFYSVVTVTGNILHAPPTPLGWFVAALPPLSLILGTECLRVMAKHILEQQAALTTLAQLNSEIDARRADLDRLTGNIDRAAAELDKLQQEIKAGKVQQNRVTVADMNAVRQANIETRRQEVLRLHRQKVSQEQIATRLGVSVRTVRNDLVALNGKVGGIP